LALAVESQPTLRVLTDQTLFLLALQQQQAAAAAEILLITQEMAVQAVAAGSGLLRVQEQVGKVLRVAQALQIHLQNQVAAAVLVLVAVRGQELLQGQAAQAQPVQFLVHQSLMPAVVVAALNQLTRAAQAVQAAVVKVA
jgi:hypothetical protein